MANGRATISHVVINCFDFRKMVEYYTKTLGFYLSDIGTVGDIELCFLTFDPEAEHHQLALTGGRKGEPGTGALNHVCFRLATYKELQGRHRMLNDIGASGMRTVTSRLLALALFSRPRRQPDRVPLRLAVVCRPALRQAR